MLMMMAEPFRPEGKAWRTPLRTGFMRACCEREREGRHKAAGSPAGPGPRAHPQQQAVAQLQPLLLAGNAGAGRGEAVRAEAGGQAVEGGHCLRTRCCVVRIWPGILRTWIRFR